MDELLGVLGLSEPATSVDDIAADLVAITERFGAASSADPVEALLDRREAARRSKDWDVADGIRDALNELGIVIEDSADGVRWYRR